jgi:hypothetical protein
LIVAVVVIVAPIIVIVVVVVVLHVGGATIIGAGWPGGFLLGRDLLL